MLSSLQKSNEITFDRTKGIKKLRVNSTILLNKIESQLNKFIDIYLKAESSWVLFLL